MTIAQRSNLTSRAGLRSAAVWVVWVTVFIALGAAAAAQRVIANIAPVATVSAASYDAAAIAPESIVASFGTMLATTTVIASDADPNTPGIQLPTTLGGTTVEVKGRRAGLFFVSPGQVNYVIPAATEIGPASVVIRAGDGVTSTGTIQVSEAAPAVFTANGDGQGVPAARLLRVKSNGAQQYEPLAYFDYRTNRFTTKPINPGPEGERVFLILFLSGLRRAPDPNRDGNLIESVRVVAGGTELTPIYAGRQPDFVGLDQINVELQRGMVGRWLMNVVVTVQGAAPAKPVQVEMATAAGNFARPRAFDDFKVTKEDEPLAIKLAGSAAGLRYVVTSKPLYGTVSGSGQDVTYKPDRDYDGSKGEDQFQFIVNDGVEESSPGTVRVGITPVNDKPSLTVPGAQSANAGQTLSFTVSATDADQGQTLNCVALNPPPGAALNRETANSWVFTWTPTFTQSGYFLVDFKVTDNDGQAPLSDVKSVAIAVGAKWARTSGPEGGRVFNLFSFGESLFAATFSNGLFLSTDGGRSWREVNRGLRSRSIYAMAAIGGTIFAGTVGVVIPREISGGIYRSTDNGQNWVEVSNGLTNRNVISLVASGNVLYAGASGSVFRSIDSGASWTPVGTGLPNNLVYVVAAGSTVLAKSGENVYRLSDNGVNWIPVTDGLSGIRASAILGVFNATVFLADGDRGIFRLAGNGQSWVRVAASPPVDGSTLTSFTLDADRTSFLVGTMGKGIFRSSGDGGSWTPLNTDLTDLFIFSLAMRGADLFAASFYDGIFRSSNRGQNWAPANAGLVGTVMRAFAFNGNTVYAGVGGGGVYRSTNQGLNWTSAGLRGKYVYALIVSGTSLLAGTGEGVYRSTDEGANWSLVLNALVEVMAGGGSTIFAADYRSGLYRSVNRGESWTPINGFSAEQVIAVAVNANNVFAISTVLRHSTDGGQTWTTVNSNLPISQAQGIEALVASGGNLFAGHYGLGVFRSSNQGRSWTPVNNGLKELYVFSMAASSDGRTIFAATVHDGIFFSTNSGESWAPAIESLANTYSIYALAVDGPNLYAGLYGNGVSLLTNNVQSWTEANLGLTSTAINAIEQPGIDIFAAAQGGVFRSTDGGRNWVSAGNGIPPGENVTSLAVTGGGAVLYAGTYGSGVYRSTNRGASWQAANTDLKNRFVNSLIVLGATLFAGTNGGFYRSADQGLNWTPANEGLTSFHILTLAVSGTTLYAGTDGGGIFISTNNGINWAASNRGLTSLAVRTIGVNGVVLYAGTLVGGIFRSTNGGQSWTAVNNNLPKGLSAFSFAASGTKLYAGTVYGVFVSTDDGANWKQVNAGLLNIYVTSVAVSGKNLLVGTQGGGVFASQIPD